MAAFDPLTAILNTANTILDRVLPDKTANDQAKIALLQAQLNGELQAMVSQLQVDQAEAQSKSLFVAGWRPWVGWGCGCAFVYAYILQPLIQTLLVVFHSGFDPAKLPKLDMSEMMPVLLGMLGLGALRSYDKNNGSSNGH